MAVARGLLNEMPEAVERGILFMLGEAELLACSELSHGPISKAAREDTYWRHHFERRWRGSAREAASDHGGDGGSYFARAVRFRHCEIFRRPPSLQCEALGSFSCETLLPLARNSGAQLVFLSVGQGARVALHGTTGEELIAETCVVETGSSVQSSSISEIDSFLLPEPAVPVLAAATDSVANSIPHSQEVVAAVAQSPVIKGSPGQGGKKKSKTAGKRSPLNMASKPTVSPSTPHADAIIASPTATVKPRVSAAECADGGAVVLLVDGRYLPYSSLAARVLRVDKWGDVYRGGFLSEMQLPWPQQSLLVQSQKDTSQLDHVVDVAGSLPGDASALATPASGHVLSCAIFGNGRFVVLGTESCGTLIWDLAGVDGAPLFVKGNHHRRREGRGPCFKCGGADHRAKACPEASLSENQLPLSPQLSGGTGELSPKMALQQSSRTKSQSGIDPLKKHPLQTTAKMGPITAVAGKVITVGEGSSGSSNKEGSSGSSNRALACIILIVSASAQSLSCHVGRDSLLQWEELFDEQPSEAANGTTSASKLGRIQSLCIPDVVAPSEESSYLVRCLVWAVCEQGVAVLAVDCSCDEASREWATTPLAMCARSSEHLLTVASAISQPQGSILVGSAAGHVIHFKTKHAGGSKDVALATNTGVVGEGTRDGDDLRNQPGAIKCRAFGTPSKVAAAVTCLAADRRLPVFVSGCTDGSVRIWDLASWQCLRTLRFFGQGSVTALTLLVCAPLRGIAVAVQKEPHLRVAWFGAAPAATANVTVAAKRQQYCENPGKASTCQDWRGTVANTRKVDTNYAAAEFRHRGTQRKERRDLAARVKDQGRSSTRHSMATTDDGSTSGRGTGTDDWWEEHSQWYEDDAYHADYLEGYSGGRAQGVARLV